MSVYNDSAFLDRSVQSILTQTYADFEFLIVNDGSSDGSTEILRAHAARDPRIRLIEQENRGLIASLNRAIGEARAPWIARMDSDDISMPQRFERQMAFLEAHPEVGVLGCQRWRIDPDGRRLPDGSPYPTDPEAFQAAMRENRPLLCHPGTMIRKDLVETTGGYRSAFRHCEDYDFWLRLSGHTGICSVDEALLQYRVRPGQVTTRHFLEMCTGVAIALQAHLERSAGRSDPISGLSQLPPIDDLDRIFGRPGVSSAARTQVAGMIVRSLSALAGGGIQLLADHVAAGGGYAPAFRSTAFLVRHGRVWLALQLLGAVASAALKSKPAPPR